MIAIDLICGIKNLFNKPYLSNKFLSFGIFVSAGIFLTIIILDDLSVSIGFLFNDYKFIPY